MPVSAFSAAKRTCIRADWSLSNLQIQKLLYIAHTYHLGAYNEPLVLGRFEAWDYGPVHPQLYHYLKVFGALPVEGFFKPYTAVSDDTPEAESIDMVVDALGNESPTKLVTITHREHGAWAINYSTHIKNIISNEDILEEYNEIMNEPQGQVAAQ